MKSQLENNKALWIDTDSNIVIGSYYLNTSTSKRTGNDYHQHLLENIEKLDDRIKKVSKTANQSYIKAPLKTTSYR